MKRTYLPAVLILTFASCALLWKAREHPVPVRTSQLAADSADDDEMEKFGSIARFAARQAVCRELLARRLTVAEAAAVYGWLDHQPPHLPAPPHEIVELTLTRSEWAGSDLVRAAREREQWLCLRVTHSAIELARSEFPAGADAVSKELVAELRHSWASGALTTLPEVDESGCRLLFNHSLAGATALATVGPVPSIPAAGIQLVVRQ